ncbi:hypothetical protein KC341_g102 [Hortaea werneckii]|nr:hypothetical protein KC341_g102 [Hortaea werneckii]
MPITSSFERRCGRPNHAERALLSTSVEASKLIQTPYVALCAQRLPKVASAMNLSPEPGRPWQAALAIYWPSWNPNRRNDNLVGTGSTFVGVGTNKPRLRVKVSLITYAFLLSQCTKRAGNPRSRLPMTVILLPAASLPHDHRLAQLSETWFLMACILRGPVRSLFIHHAPSQTDLNSVSHVHQHSYYVPALRRNDLRFTPITSKEVFSSQKARKVPETFAAALAQDLSDNHAPRSKSRAHRGIEALERFDIVKYVNSAFALICQACDCNCRSEQPRTGTLFHSIVVVLLVSLLENTIARFLGIFDWFISSGIRTQRRQAECYNRRGIESPENAQVKVLRRHPIVALVKHCVRIATHSIIRTSAEKKVGKEGNSPVSSTTAGSNRQMRLPKTPARGERRPFGSRQDSADLKGGRFRNGSWSELTRAKGGL